MAAQIISHYRIINKIGEGGMGQVYLAEDVRLHRKVALKVLPIGLLGNQQLVLRFQQEALAASALNHPNILTIYDIGQIDNTHFIATEFVRGETLRERMNRGRLEFDDVLTVVTQIASALKAAHDAGIVHRDIKPENIMRRPDGYVKVLDFGLAKLREPQMPSGTTTLLAPLARTEPGIVLGTPKYMSPEQVRGLDVDGRSDIFSLGIMLYEMVAGTHPFNGETISDILAAILQTEPSMLEGSEGWPVALTSVLKRALRKNVNERYQSVEELVADLRSIPTQPEPVRGRQRSTLPIGSPAAQQKKELLEQLPSPSLPESPNRLSVPVSLSRSGRQWGKFLRVRSLFMVFLIVALMGLAASIYTHFAEKPVLSVLDSGSGLIGKGGVISGALNVNLRSEPNGAVLVTLPANSRVRILEERGNYFRVRVLSWAGETPANAPDSGWVSKQFVNTD